MYFTGKDPRVGTSRTAVCKPAIRKRKGLADVIKRGFELTEGVEIDMDKPLPPEDVVRKRKLGGVSDLHIEEQETMTEEEWDEILDLAYYDALEEEWENNR